MDNPYPDWTAQLERDGILQHMPSITRGLAATNELTLTGDFSADSFSMELKASPDAATTLATFTCTPGAFTGGVTTVTLSLGAAAQSNLPADTDGNGIETVLYDLVCNPAGGEPYRMMAGLQPITGAIT